MVLPIPADVLYQNKSGRPMANSQRRSPPGRVSGLTRFSSHPSHPSQDGACWSKHLHQVPPKACSVFTSIAAQSAARSSPRSAAIARTVTGTRYDALVRPR